MRQTIQHVLFRTTIARRLTLMSLSTIVGQFAIIVVSPIVTRLYGPYSYGAFVAVAGTIGMVAVLVGAGYGAAIPMCKKDSEAAALVWLVWFITVAFTIFVACLLAAAGPWLGRTLGLDGHTALIWWLLPASAVQGLFLGFDGWAMYQGVMRQLAWSKIVHGIGIAAGQIIFGVIGSGDPNGLLLAYVLGQAFGVLPIVLRLNSEQRRLFLRPNAQLIIALAHRYRRFSRYGVWSRGLGNAAEMLLPILTASIFGATASGLVGLAQRIVGLPIRLLGVSAAQVYVAELTKIQHHEHSRQKRLFNETVGRLLVVGILYLGTVAAFGPPLFGLLFGHAWTDAGELARLLTPMYLALLINRPVRFTVQYYERQELGLLANAFSVLIVILAFAMAYVDMMNIWTTSIVVGFGLCITNITSFLVARSLIVGRFSRYQSSGNAREEGKPSARRES